MKKLFLLPIALFLIPFVSFSQNSWQWAITAGALNNESISSVACDSEGHIYVAGSFQGSYDFFGETLISMGDYDVFVACFTPQGNLVWVEQGGGNLEDIPRDIYVDDQHIYVTGGFTNQAVFGDETLISAGARDMFLLKYDLEGNLQWAISGGSVTDDRGNSVVADDAGNIYIVGDINYAATFGDFTVSHYGFTDVFLAKYNADAICQWATSAGGSVYDHGSCIDVVDNEIFIGGGFNGEAVFGDTSVLSVDFVDIYIAHYLTDGTFVEVVSAGGTNNENINALAVDSDQNVYVGGWFIVDITIGENTYYSTTDDAFLAKYTPGVGFIWSQQLGGTGIDELTDLFCDQDDQLIAAGIFENSINIGTSELLSEGFNDGFVGKFDPSGVYEWVFQMGGSGTLRINGCTSDTNGNCYFAGDFVDELIIGNQTFNPAGGYDLFLARLSEGNTYINENNSYNSLQARVQPNPFTSSTIIEYELKQTETVTFIVYDHWGKQVYQLQEHQSQGRHELIWNAETYADGFYYFMVNAGEIKASGKMLKVK